MPNRHPGVKSRGSRPGGPGVEEALERHTFYNLLAVGDPARHFRKSLSGKKAVLLGGEQSRKPSQRRAFQTKHEPTNVPSQDAGPPVYAAMK